MKKLSQINWANVLRPQTGNLQNLWTGAKCVSHRPLERTPSDALAVSGPHLEAVGEQAALEYLSDPALRRLDTSLAELFPGLGETAAVGA